MILLIETCLDSYLIALIENNQVKKYFFKTHLIKKSDVLAEDVSRLIDSKIKDLKAIYVTNGPGSFMGVRAGLIFGFTLAKALNIDFYTASSLDFVSNDKSGRYYLDAKSKQSYAKNYPYGKVELVPFMPSSKFDLKYFLKSPQVYLKMFQKTKLINPNYIKEPKIG